MARDVSDGSLPRQRARSGAAALCVAIVAVAFAGCGGGDNGAGTAASSQTTTGNPTISSTTTSPTGNGANSTTERVGLEKQVHRAVEAALTSGDPAGACGRYVTARYLKSAYGGKQGCVQAQQPGSAATSLAAFRIERERGQATLVGASAVPRGGPYDGSKVKIGLVFTGDHYRVDQLVSNVPVGP